jgi:hypothetical protein
MAPVPSRSRETGERLCPEPHMALSREHLSGYELAARLFALCGQAPLPSEWYTQAARP